MEKDPFSPATSSFELLVTAILSGARWSLRLLRSDRVLFCTKHCAQKLGCASHRGAEEVLGPGRELTPEGEIHTADRKKAEFAEGCQQSVLWSPQRVIVYLQR